MREPPNSDRPEFGTTHWSLVTAAKPDAASQSRARHALEELCRAYWYPLYAFVRNRGYSANDAQDLTQSFFSQLIETRGFESADPSKGRFRSYLLGAMKHFLANEWHRAQTLKRGGGLNYLDLDALDAEARYSLEAATTTNPDANFDREWAHELIARATIKLQSEFQARGKSQMFDRLKGCLVGRELIVAETARMLGMSRGAVKVAVHRLRNRYRELVRAEIAETVGDPSEIDTEMLYLLAALREN